MTPTSTTYIGRFAPSPTGALHAGSLIAALASYVDARAQGGQWRLRIDDLDAPRVVPGARGEILRTLEAHGLYWDGPVVEQSARKQRYAEALAKLDKAGDLYACTCSRREIARVAATGPLGRVYPGTCRKRSAAPGGDAALRLALPSQALQLSDDTCGPIALRADIDVGDVVVRRRDGLPAYHVATTVDDADLGITHVVRGADLLPAAVVQTVVQRRLGLPASAWRHLPLARTPDGDKLSKQTGAQPLDATRPIPALLAAWSRLGQMPPPETPTSAADFLEWAIAHWRTECIPAESAPAAVPQSALHTPVLPASTRP